MTIGFPFSVGALSSLNKGFGDLKICQDSLGKANARYRERSTACRSPGVRQKPI